MGKIQFLGLIILKNKRDSMAYALKALNGIVAPSYLEELNEEYQELNKTIEYMEMLEEK